MTHIRELQRKDAYKMFQWMHNKNVVQYMEQDFLHMTIENCIQFIEKAKIEEKSKHFAIVDDMQQYIGTISLKNIENDYAEFAIILCEEAIGKGYARKAMEEVLAYGFKTLGIKRIFWNVLKENTRAIRFYDKKYKKQDTAPDFIQYKIGYNKVNRYYWYIVSREDI